MKISIAGFMCVVFVSLRFCVCGEEVKTNSAPLNIGVDEFEPYTYQLGDQITGYSIEVIQGVLKNMGMTSSVKIYPWARVVAMLENGEIDVLIGFKTEERQQIAWFPTEPMGQYSYVVIIRKEDVDKIKYRSFEDLKGRSIGLQRGTVYQKEFLEYANQHAKLEYVTRVEQNFLKLEGKRFDCVIEEAGVAVASIRKLHLEDKLVILNETPVFQKNFYTALSKRRFREEDARKFSEELKKFKTTDEYKKIFAKYFTLESHRD